MEIIVQTYLGNAWHDAATISFEQPTAGYVSPASVSYGVDYFSEQASRDYDPDYPIRDLRALSIRNPVDLDTRRTSRWPAFLFDLLPQGNARERLSKSLKLDPNQRETDLPLLLRAAGSPVGNLRIKEAAQQEEIRLQGIRRCGLTLQDILKRTDQFLEVVDDHALLASGSSGLQGEWPKIALTMATDGLYYPDPMVGDNEAMEHVIVKLQRQGSEYGVILETEAVYSRVGQEIGLNVYLPSTAGNGSLLIPRFDRSVDEDGHTWRYGQESMMSAVGVADFGQNDTHERYVQLLKDFSDDPQTDILEYLKRDAANLALGNHDNHGRNTAISKYSDGSIRLSPLFDFAPMKLARDTIVRSTKWACMRDGGSDYNPDWAKICEVVAGDDLDPQVLASGLVEFADRLEHAPRLAVELGANPEAIEMATNRCSDIVSGLRELKSSLDHSR